jgi:preprotein translocase subunit SecG
MSNVSASYRVIVLITFFIYTIALIAIVLLSKRKQKNRK